MTAGKDTARTARLKAALRDNLRRRKVQGRGRTEPDAPREPAEDVGERDAPPADER